MKIPSSGRNRMKFVEDKMLAASQLPKRTIALVLAGGRGTRLHQLTDNRAKPAVYFGGKFRIIDFALSNCINSGIRLSLIHIFANTITTRCVSE